MRVWPMIIGLVFLAPLETQFAESSPKGQALSLSEAVEIAQRENFQINVGRESVEAARNGIRVSRAEYLPTLNVAGSVSDYDGVVYVRRFLNPADPSQPNPEGGETDIGPYNSTTAAIVRLSQTIYSGSNRGQGLRQPCGAQDRSAGFAADEDRSDLRGDEGLL